MRGGCRGSRWGNRREGDHWGDLGVDGRIILGRISRRWDVGIWTAVLYGCETWSLTLREERNLGVFENMVLRRIFGPMRDEVTGEWRRLHNEEMFCTAHPILCG